jgi:Protein of unknown function (DUF3039)
MSQTLEIIETETKIELDDEGNEIFAHYAEKVSITAGYVMGTPVQAVCGKVFVPSKNPEKLRVCPACKEIMDALFLENE